MNGIKVLVLAGIFFVISILVSTLAALGIAALLVAVYVFEHVRQARLRSASAVRGQGKSLSANSHNYVGKRHTVGAGSVRDEFRPSWEWDLQDEPLQQSSFARRPNRFSKRTPLRSPRAYERASKPLRMRGIVKPWGW